MLYSPNIMLYLLITVFKVYELYLNVIISVTLCAALLIIRRNFTQNVRLIKFILKVSRLFVNDRRFAADCHSATCPKNIRVFLPQLDECMTKMRVVGFCTF